MESIVGELVSHGFTREVLTSYLMKACAALDEAYNAAENDADISMGVKVGEAKSYLDFVKAAWPNVFQ